MGIIEIKNFSFAYGRNEDVEKKYVVKNVNLNIDEGEFFVLCGKSGCGKSTLLKALKKSIAPFGTKSGEIMVAGENVENIEPARESRLIGFVMQNPDNQIVTDKVWHELAFGLESMGIPNDVIRIRVAEMSTYFGINDWFHKDVSKLSGGQKQLLNLASVMAMNPQILVLDEPTSQLDPIAAGDFIETVKKINRDFGTTIIMTEHRLEEVIPIADETALMENGEIKFSGNAEDMLRFLYDTKNDMLISMPTPARIALEFGTQKDIPLTVGTGKRWLKQKTVSTKGQAKISRDVSDLDKVISLKNLYFAYEKADEYVIDGLNLNVMRGEIFALLGGNGSGKSTLLSLIAGVETALSGKILINDIKIQKIRKELLYNGIVGVLPQNPQCLFARKTVAEELAEMHNQNDIESVIKITELDKLKDSHPYDLSGGEQQRLALAKILLLNPQILLLDEPTKGMDGYYKKQFGEMLNKLKDSGITVFIVSHDVEFCAEYADRCGLLFDGKVTSIGTPQEFFGGNIFYTTAANKMSNGVIENCITTEEVIGCLKK